MISVGTATVTGRDVPCPDGKQIQTDMADLWYSCHVLERSVGGRFGVDLKVARLWWARYRAWGGKGN